jgi:hypothetical protein
MGAPVAPITFGMSGGAGDSPASNKASAVTVKDNVCELTAGNLLLELQQTVSSHSQRAVESVKPGKAKARSLSAYSPWDFQLGDKSNDGRPTCNCDRRFMRARSI